MLIQVKQLKMWKGLKLNRLLDFTYILMHINIEIESKLAINTVYQLLGAQTKN